MAILEFDYPVGDSRDGLERAEIIADQLNLPDDHEVFEKIGRPFHEVILSCALDTNTGAVTILNVKR